MECVAEVPKKARKTGQSKNCCSSFLALFWEACALIVGQWLSNNVFKSPRNFASRNCQSFSSNICTPWPLYFSHYKCVTLAFPFIHQHLGVERLR